MLQNARNQELTDLFVGWLLIDGAEGSGFR
jgi:hypothetical protein